MSFSASKYALITLYSKHKVLPLSGKAYHFSEQTCSSDGYVNVKGEDEMILWRRLIPESFFGLGMRCMSEKLCHSTFSDRDYSGARCCRKISPPFKKMSSDLHHIIPTLLKEDIPNLLRLDSVKDKGAIARSVLYMLKQYKLSIDAQLLTKFKKWHQDFPVSRWEKLKNKKIYELQGTFNPYIEKL